MILRRSSGRKPGNRQKSVLTGILLGALLIAFLALLPTLYLRIRDHSGNDRRQLRTYFEGGSFEESFLLSEEMLKARPLDAFLLTIHGFSSYQLGIAQINTFDTLTYINNAIWSLRKALLSSGSAQDGSLYYVLGKAYFYKGPDYADLAVNYLERARSTGFMAADIPEYLGLSHAALGDYRSSVIAFSQALGNPSDLLLLSIAHSYTALEEYDLARAYLNRSLEISRDSNTINTARLNLANILTRTGHLEEAEIEYLVLIENNGENAEAHYQLGELYALQGDLTRARAEWRRAIRIDPAHGPARRRLN